MQVQFAGDVYLRGIRDYRSTNDSQFNKNTNTMIDTLQSRVSRQVCYTPQKVPSYKLPCR